MSNINKYMHRKKYNTNDNDLIWESLQNRVDHNLKHEMEDLLEADLKYIEQFLMNEGLMDGVKGAFGKVKDFATQKLLKPVIDMLVGALAKDPEAAQKVAGAMEQGPEAIAALAQTEGDPSVQQQIQSTPTGTEAGTAAEGYTYQFQMNDMICEALVDAGLITSRHSQVIQERYYTNTINTLFSEAIQPTECPWMPASGYINENKTIAKQIDQLAKSAPGGSKAQVFPQLYKINKRFQNFVKAQSQGAATPEAPASVTPTESEPSQTTSTPDNAPVTPTAEVPSQDAQTPNSAPIDPGAVQGGQGVLGKIWNFLKNNKGILTGAVAIGVLGLMMTNPVTATIALPAMKTGLAGAGIGFAKGVATTQGGVKDRLMGGLNSAGKTGAMAAGAAGLAGAAGGLMGGGETADVPDSQIDPNSQPPIDSTSTQPMDVPPPVDVPPVDAPQVDAPQVDAPQELPYDPDQEETFFQRSGADQYHRDEFNKSLSPREKMNLRPGTQGYRTAFNKYLQSAQTPI